MSESGIHAEPVSVLPGEGIAELLMEVGEFRFPAAGVLRVLKNFLSQAGASLVAQALAFISTAYLARRLQAEGLGWIGFAQGLIVYFTLLTDLGLRTIGLREVAQDRENVPKWVGQIVALRIVLAILSYILFLGIVALMPKPTEFKQFLLLFGFLIFTSALLLDWAFQGLERMELVGVGETMRAAGYLGLVLIWVKGPSQIFRIPVFFLLSHLLPVALLFGIFWRHFRRISLTADFALWKELLRQSLPISIGALMLQLGSGLNIILLGLLRGEAEVGYYSAAYRLAFMPTSLTSVLSFVMFPVMARYWRNQREKLEVVTRYTGRLLILMVLPIVTPGWMFAPSLISIVYGKGFQGSILPFQILLGYLLVAHMYSAFYYLLPACGMEKAFMKSLMAGAAVGAGTNLIFIPIYGAMGAALATLAAHVTILVQLYRASSRGVVVVPLGKELLRALPVAVFMGIAMGLTPTGWLIKLAVGLTVYTGLVAIRERRTWAELGQSLRIRKSIVQDGR